MAQRSYTREEMEEIFRRAAERTQAQEDAVRHEDLVAAAREVGIDPSTLDDALAELGEEKTAEAAAARWTREARQRFVSHFSAYAIVMTFLGALNVLATPGIWWALYVGLAWGLGVAFSARRALLRPTTEQVERLLAREEKRAAKKAAREARRQAAEAWRRRWRELGDEAKAAAEARKRRGSVLAQTEREIDRAIEEGVTALVAALGRRAANAAEALGKELGAAGTAAPAPRTDFDRYVAEKKVAEKKVAEQKVAEQKVAQQRAVEPPRPAPARASQGPLVTPPPPRTRVAEPEADREEDEDAESPAHAPRRARR